MRSIRILCAVFTAAFFCATESKSQIAVPIGTLPTYYNGGFAGEAGAPRVASFSYLQRSFSTNPRISRLSHHGTFISVDHFLKKIRSGVAFTASSQNFNRAFMAGSENFNSNSNGAIVSMAISPKFSFKGKYTFAPFADFSYARFHTRWTNDPPNLTSDYVTHNFKIQSGFLINSARAYLGVSANVASYATEVSTMEEKWRTLSNMVYTLQAGHTFQRTPESKFSFTPQLALSFMSYSFMSYQNNGNIMTKVRVNVINLMDLNLMCRYGKLIGGINSSGLVLGYQTEKFRLQMTNFYSGILRYGNTIEITDHTWFNTKPYIAYPETYTGNIALRYVFRKKETVKLPGF